MFSSAEIEDTLQRVFGFKKFRKGQREAILAILEHKSVLCIQPTGHGKSLLYQLPTCLLKGMTLVISPLIALMRDQIEQLHKRFHIPAATINSDQNEEENARSRRDALEGKSKILFVSPEQLDHIDRFEFLSSLPIALLVIDEAHCISTWGHDFRPSYRQILPCIQAIAKKNPTLKVLALTATADHRVEQDVKQQLATDATPHVFREEMDRPNISLSVMALSGLAQKLHETQTLLERLEGCGLVYCATRENTELVAAFLQEQGMHTIAYHAGIDPEEKRRIQQEFIEDKYKVIVATTALGMGIDKASLRFILHFDIPGSITAYYQEVGRCGRDGRPAQGILLYDPADKKIQEYFIDSALPSADDFEKVFNAIKTATESPSLSLIKRTTGLHPTRALIARADIVVEQKASTLR